MSSILAGRLRDAGVSARPVLEINTNSRSVAVQKNEDVLAGPPDGEPELLPESPIALRNSPHEFRFCAPAPFHGAIFDRFFLAI
jgi:hypothetical protein